MVYLSPILKLVLVLGYCGLLFCTKNPPLESEVSANYLEIDLVYPQGKVQASNYHRKEIEYKHNGITELFEFTSGSSSPVVIEADCGDRILVQVREYNAKDYLTHQGDTLHIVGYEDVVYLDIVMRLQVPPPSFLGKASDSLLVAGNPYQISLTNTAGGPGVAVHCSLLAGPLGLTVSDSGLVIWLPAAALSRTPVTVAVLDEFGQGDTLSWALTVIAADSLAPIVEITSPTANPYFTSDPIINLSGTASDDQSLRTLCYTLSDGRTSYERNTLDLGDTTRQVSWDIMSITLRTDSTYIIVSASDSAGGTGSDTLLAILTLVGPDNISPIVHITNPAARSILTNSSSLLIEGIAKDISGIASVVYTLTGVSTGSGAVSGIDPWTLNLSLLEGVTDVIIVAQDSPGNVGGDTVTVRADLTPPSPPLVTGPSSPTTNLMPTWTWQSVDGMGLYRYRLDSGGYLDTTTDTSYTPQVPLTEGTHTLYVQERDSAGNWSNDGSFGITINTGGFVAPTVTGITPCYDGKPQWDWTSGGGDGVYRYKLDDADLSTGAHVGADTFYASDIDLTEGPHILYVQEQYASQWSQTGSFSIQVMVNPPRIIYVDHAASGQDKGVSWLHAFRDLQSALSIAKSGDQIWVAKGTYKPTKGTDRDVSFVTKDSVNLYGGFAGMETSLAQRNWKENSTILSGDIGSSDQNIDNSYFVVRGFGGSIDGFTICDGLADKTGAGAGGAIYLFTSLDVKNCIMRDNAAASLGGAIYGGVSASAKVENCFFIDNQSEQGGALAIVLSTINLSNCVFAKNQADRAGAIWIAGEISPSITSCTFYGNNASDRGGAIYNGTSMPLIANSIFWANEAGSGGNEIYCSWTTYPQIRYSCIRGSYGSGSSWNSSFGTDSGGNIDVDPRFLDTADVDGADNIFGTSDDGFALQPYSLCIDAGTSDGTPSIDITGLGRPQVGGYDIGAYESPVSTRNTWQTKASMPTARSALGVAVLGDKLYAIGGALQGAFGPSTDIVEIYTPSIDQWASGEQMPVDRKEFGICSIQGSIYVIGGYRVYNDGQGLVSQILASMEKFEPGTGWISGLPSMPTPRQLLGVATVNDTIYAIGGYAGGSLDIVEAYHPSTGWTVRTKMPIACHGFAIGVVDNKVYVLGGNASGNLTSRVHAYDPATDSWTEKRSMPTARYCCAASVIANKIVVVGGANDFNTMEEYNPFTDEWRELSPGMPTGRGELSCGVIGDKLYAVGGSVVGSSVVMMNTVEMYLP